MTTLTGRLTTAYALLATGTAVVVLVLGHWLLHAQLIRGIDLLNEAEFRELEARTGPIAGDFDPAIRKLVADHAAIDAPLYLFQVVDPSGAVLFRSANLGRESLPAGGPGRRTAVVPELGRLRIAEFPLGRSRLLIASPLNSVEQMMASALRVGVLLTGAVAVASLALGYAFSRLALRPLRTIARTAERIGADTLDARIPVPHAQDELADLSRLLNRMFDRIQRAFEEVHRFTGEASHELKTPLALARLHAEKLARADLPPAQQEAVQALLAEIHRLQQVIDSLLLLAKAESGAMELGACEQNPQSFIAGFAEDAGALAEDQGRRFILAANEPMRARFDPGWVRHVLLNLLSNALRFTPAGGAITLHSRARDGRWQLVLEDEGPGVPPGDCERIFGRFVQLGEPTHGGSGLGLAIARSIVLRHGGTIRAENRTDRTGLRILCELQILD